VRLSGTRAAVALLALLALLAPVLLTCVAGCSKDDADQPHRVKSLGGRPIPVPPPVVTDETPEAPGTHAEIVRIDAAPIYYTVKSSRDVAAPPVDPDLAVIASGRLAAARCFTGITDGSLSRSASIHVTVLPSGTVNRSEVSSDSTTEPWILTCLEDVGSGLHFADKPAADIRGYSIGVTVTLTH